MAREMEKWHKRVASNNLLKIRNSHVMLPSEVYTVTSLNEPGQWVSLQQPVL